MYLIKLNEFILTHSNNLFIWQKSIFNAVSGLVLYQIIIKVKGRQIRFYAEKINYFSIIYCNKLCLYVSMCINLYFNYYV